MPSIVCGARDNNARTARRCQFKVAFAAANVAAEPAFAAQAI